MNQEMQEKIQKDVELFIEKFDDFFWETYNLNGKTLNCIEKEYYQKLYYTCLCATMINCLISLLEDLGLEKAEYNLNRILSAIKNAFYRNVKLKQEKGELKE